MAMAQIGLGLVGVLVGGSFLWAATAGAEGLGLVGDQAHRRRSGLIASAAVLVAVGVLGLVGGLVELAR